MIVKNEVTHDRGRPIQTDVYKFQNLNSNDNLLTSLLYLKKDRNIEIVIILSSVMKILKYFTVISNVQTKR